MFVSYKCVVVPVTGRKQLSLISNEQILPMSFQSYKAVLDTSKRSKNKAWTAMVKQVGRRIQGAVAQYMFEHNLQSYLKGYKWEFNLIEADIVNAWCMPGGKVVFYTGIIPVCGDETGVAVVMGHEIAHAIANHGRERMSQEMVQQLGGVALDVALANKPEETRAMYELAYGLGTTYGAILPYSRLHESEADKMGLIFMAMAGYDPHAAPEFWKRMQKKSGGQAPPEFLSTHPAPSHRIADLEAMIPEAMKYFRPKK
jgi:predicted Zn-dependent protease